MQSPTGWHLDAAGLLHEGPMRSARCNEQDGYPIMQTPYDVRIQYGIDTEAGAAEAVASKTAILSVFRNGDAFPALVVAPWPRPNWNASDSVVVKVSAIGHYEALDAVRTALAPTG